MLTIYGTNKARTMECCPIKFTNQCTNVTILNTTKKPCASFLTHAKKDEPFSSSSLWHDIHLLVRFIFIVYLYAIFVIFYHITHLFVNYIHYKYTFRAIALSVYSIVPLLKVLSSDSME